MATEVLVAPVTCVKWATPTDEVVGIATLARGLVASYGVNPERMCLVAPNRTWAKQIHRACEHVGLRSTVCIAPDRLSVDEQAACAKLEVLAHPFEKETHGARSNLGCSREEVQQLVDSYGSSRALTLIRVLGLRDMPVFAHALQHIRGDEDASALSALVHEQLIRPTVPVHAGLTPVMQCHTISGSFDWVFLIGCVNGLIPGSAAFEAATEQEQTCALDADRHAFYSAASCAGDRVVVSCFTKLDAELARQAHVCVARYKKEHGEHLALTTPTLFLDEAGSNRPTTISGQALLREYNLN